MTDDPDYITELDIDERGPWVECEWGYDGCTGADYADEMLERGRTPDGGWMCVHCENAALDELADDLRARRRVQ